MPSAYAPIPIPNRGQNSALRTGCQPAFAAPVRWTLVVLSWLAFGIASYLAYASVTGASVAGCGAGAANGCDVVLSSSWSKWLGVPVAVLGLACYATLASLSVLLGWRSEPANRWITTAFVMLSIIAAGASLWFIGVQVFAIGDLCKYCLVTDACGILIGTFAVAAAVQCKLTRRASPQPRGMQPGVMALRTATTPIAARPSSAAASTVLLSTPPSLAVALAGAVPLLLILIGGQLLFPGTTYEIEQTALNDPIKMDDAAGSRTSDPSAATTHTALRVPDPLEGNESQPSNDGELKQNPAQPSDEPQPDRAAANTAAPPSTGTETTSATPAPEPPRERILSLLGGKLTLNTYQHPIIGSPEAPHVVVEMISYNCPHCRKLHPLVQKALDRYGDQVAVLVMPIPFEKGCNKLITDEAASHVGACGTVRRACGIARLNPRAFVKFHDFLMSGGDEPPTMEEIVPKSNGLVSRDPLREIIGSPEVKKQVEGYIDLFAQLQAKSRNPKTFGLPVQILGDHVVNKSVEKVEDLYKIWEQDLGVKPK
jgi:uncharacterized membrane protein